MILEYRMGSLLHKNASPAHTERTGAKRTTTRRVPATVWQKTVPYYPILDIEDGLVTIPLVAVWCENQFTPILLDR